MMEVDFSAAMKIAAKIADRLNLPSHMSLCPLHAEMDRAYAVTEQAFASVTIASLLNSTNPIVPLIDSP